MCVSDYTMLNVGNPHITVQLPAHGGHCGFIEKSNGGYDGYWAEREIVEFVKRHCT